MDNKEYSTLVNQDQYPENIRVPLDAPFLDSRGVIQNLWLASSGSVTFIKSKRGSIRAQHRHTQDWHATYIITGKVKYLEGEPDSTEKIEIIFTENDMFFTKPDVYHVMEFLEDTVMITINNIVKNHENYENSVVRK